MPTLIGHAAGVQAAGKLPKLIDEHTGGLSSQESCIRAAHMRSTAGWMAQGQTPPFEMEMDGSYVSPRSLLDGSMHGCHCSSSA